MFSSWIHREKLIAVQKSKCYLVNLLALSPLQSLWRSEEIFWISTIYSHLLSVVFIVLYTNWGWEAIQKGKIVLSKVSSYKKVTTTILSNLKMKTYLVLWLRLQFHYRGHEFYPLWGNISHNAWHGQNTNKMIDFFFFF